MTGLRKGQARRAARISILAAALLACAASAAAASSSGRAESRAHRQADVAVYEGLGSWIDIFAASVWTRPEATVSSLAAHGVGTLYLQTSNYSQTTALRRPAALARFLSAAHASGLAVVAWYLPSLAEPDRDYQRALAAIRFRTHDGQGFDSFALDIEASVVRDVLLRNGRLLALGRRLRAAAGPDYPLGAIIPSPVGMERHRHYWPGFPYAPLARTFDVFLPMAYFSYYTNDSGGVYAYTRGVVRQIRAQTATPDLPIHVIGGIANRVGGGAMAGFVRALSDCAVSGASLYAYPQTTAGQWARLRDVPFGAFEPSQACR